MKKISSNQRREGLELDGEQGLCQWGEKMEWCKKDEKLGNLNKQLVWNKHRKGNLNGVQRWMG